MYKIEWSKDNKNLPILNDFAQDNIIPPRPVFFEELDLLGFNKHFKYHHTEEPLMWAIGRDYYNNSEKVAKAIGGDINNAPVLEIYQAGIELHPIDIDTLIKLNKSKIEVLKNEAIEFTKKVYKEYANKVDFFIVAFSGGKDSQVLLDLVTIALEPEQYKVIFTDTTMELPHTYETVQKTEKHYRNIYKNFKITSVRNPNDAEHLWKTFGSPSMNFRWCCSVYKTSPVMNYLKSINNNKIPKIILYNGVRAEESSQRAEHTRIAHGVKHQSQTNIEVIKYWNDFEVYLYLFYAGIKPNNGYRLGFDRMGCSICPLAKSKNDFMVKKVAPELAKKFIDIVIEDSKRLHIKDIDDYIQDGAWKRRNENNNDVESIVQFSENNKELEINLTNSKENLFEWLKVLGDYKVSKQNSHIDVSIDNQITNIGYTFSENSINLKTNERNISNLSHIKRIAYKTNYCIHCGSCEAECPTGALSVFPKVQVESDLCIHCSKCLDFHEKGCVMADVSVAKINQGNVNILKGFGKYQNFAMQSDWLNEFITNQNWFENNTLGVKQIPSMVAWMKEAGLLNDKKAKTDFFNLISKINDDKCIYGLMLINLYENSNLVKWYLDEIPWGTDKYSKNDFSLLIENSFDDFPKRSVEIGLTSLLKLFKTTPLGSSDFKIGYFTEIKNTGYVEKIGTDNVSNEAILYSLYKLKETKSRDNFRVSEFYDEGFDGGPYKIFGINKDVLTQKLRFISEETKLIDVDLNQGLDNVFLKDLSAMDVLQEVLK